MSEKEPKETVVKLEEHQFQHLSIILSNITQELKNIAGRQEKLAKECQCEISNKPRTPYYDTSNYGYAYCEICETRIAGAGKHGVIKNRNDPKFWGLEVKEKVLCGNCLENKKEKMSPLRKAEFNRYRKELQFGLGEKIVLGGLLEYLVHLNYSYQGLILVSLNALVAQRWW
ncbi:15424_t:CDS:2 [Entrophospora sp. SA101]|nr:15414_t:CDS:2 [Entrophospora sp. SA101]CAJ0629822.1 15424_t:CDS:2 [Entrophospora sp. SA101]CAJ0902113.1 4484_t:CDS:2 [Entrophospora sp. SA101]CAJ0902173.1 4494_t:CDS:2 [Entrophospora sp. SA101]